LEDPNIVTLSLFLELCPEIQELLNGNVTFTGYDVGDMVQYTCNSGYAVHGPVIRECLQSGMWSSKNSSCESMLLLLLLLLLLFIILITWLCNYSLTIMYWMLVSVENDYFIRGVKFM